MARVVPRPHVTVVNRRCAKLLKKHDVDISGTGQTVIALDDAAIHTETMRETTAVDNGAAHVLESLGEYARALSDVDATLGASAARLQEKVRYEIGKLKEKTAASLRRYDERGWQDVRELRTNLLPLGKPQERVLNVFPFLMEDGWHFIRRLLDEVDVDSGDWQTVTI